MRGNITKLIMMKRSPHQNLVADIRREIRRMKTAIVDRMVKVMLYARKDLDRSLVTWSISNSARQQLETIFLKKEN